MSKTMRTKAPRELATRSRARHAPTDVAAMTFGEQLIQGLTEAVAFERGELQGLRVTKRAVTARMATATPAPDYAPERVKRLRKAVKLSQPVFAQALNVDADTVRAWEQGRRTPNGAALRLLQLTEQHPEWILTAVHVR